MCKSVRRSAVQKCTLERRILDVQKCTSERRHGIRTFIFLHGDVFFFYIYQGIIKKRSISGINYFNVFSLQRSLESSFSKRPTKTRIVMIFVTLSFE